MALNLNIVENLAGNPVGGERQGFRESHWVSGGADLDLDKLVGWSNTKLHIQGAWFTGENLARDVVGNSISFQQTWRPVSGPRLTQFNIEHDFGRLNVTVGRMALNSYFNNSPLNCNFMTNASCLTTYGPISDIGITAYPNSSWGARAKYKVGAHGYVEAGAFEYNNDLNLKGKDGLDFSLGKGSGWLIAGEIGHMTTFKDERLPHNYKVGFYLNTDGGSSPYYNAQGESYTATGTAAKKLGGNRVGIYGLVDQTVSRAAGNSKRNLALFARAYWNVGNIQQIDWFASAGLVKTGTFIGRDEDTIDFLVSNTHFSDQEIDHLRDVRAKAGGTGSPHADEIVGEINYGFAAMPGLRIMPNVQWVLNPDPVYAPKSTKNVPSTVVLGLRIDLKFEKFFGA
ncbi:carbohydrate porin [Novosphingobium sp. 9]|uniref:carbohydrate porin n=1 Tax=Novosphingobium sp. 9 TaxID=2025349 RepID=UPI0021B6A2B2|nr:carbohydrate porin [Novosphingobium sp. 9]